MSAARESSVPLRRARWRSVETKQSCYAKQMAQIRSFFLPKTAHDLALKINQKPEELRSALATKLCRDLADNLRFVAPDLWPDLGTARDIQYLP